MKIIKKCSLLFLIVFVLFQCQMPCMQLLETTASLQETPPFAASGSDWIFREKFWLSQKTNTKNKQEIRTEVKSSRQDVHRRSVKRGNQSTFLDGELVSIPYIGNSAPAGEERSEKNYTSFSGIADKRGPPTFL